ncbi:RNA polymerase sigma factor (sigma-70 family) [Nonomuraea thailandensis]|uniref:RNA polymerase sigma factor (Sigma-70 family) n=1 Tax=Nonomuraea thailandensis TaxID=1188745 RepID=A0A9X2GWC8_9ACTN|nr:sigma-70 family RNA polymerase sigma factor [Nonomuraea thailandensis]MCP2362956.1 RNA polymerase sigma factor (sigma-70 family) [Nonomuraea thailandensis]
MGVESPQSDADLLQAVREGNAAAYGELYERHVAAARALARQLVRGAEVEDVVAESFTKILDLVGRGGGPDSGFRTYLLTVVRRTVYDRSKVESRQVTTGEIELYDPGVPFVDPALVGLEKSLIARAYLSLPERWRAVLWHTEVERAKPADVAPLLGLSANGVAALAYRAREGLRQAYLQMHLGSPPQHDCRPVLGKLGAYVRGGLARRDSKAVDEHVSACEECHGVLLELTDVNRGLRVMVGPLIAGPLFGGYAAALAKPGVVGAGGALRMLGRLRRVPKQQQVAMAGGTVAVTAAVLASLLLVADEKPIVRPPAITPVAQPPVSVAPVPVPMPLPTERPAQVPPPVKKDKPGKARLRATIDALGSLVRAQPGIVGIRLRNYGESASEKLAAQVDLPDGVTLVPPARHGHSAARLGPVGTVDGWVCRPVSGGARCARQALQAGQGTAVFLRVLVADEAPQGAGPAVRIAAGSLRLQARAEEGVRSYGAPARFATDGKVAVRAIGNTLLSCPAERAGCSETRRRQGTQRDNDLWPMTPLDQDERPDTTSSSGAELSLPKGSQVVWAGLYWSAADDEAGPIRIRPPGRRKYLTVQPGEVTMRELPLGPVYQAFADVSGLVGDVRRNGTWWAADIPMKAGVSRHAGWSLVLIVTDPAEPYSQAVVLDSATVVGGQARRVRVPLGGLSPAASPARVELVTWEGDADLKGDKVSLGSGALASGGGDRDPANVFDGSSNGVAGMTFGTDVDTVSAELGVDPGLTIVTDKDVVLFGVAALSVRARS